MLIWDQNKWKRGEIFWLRDQIRSQPLEHLVHNLSGFFFLMSQVCVRIKTKSLSCKAKTIFICTRIEIQRYFVTQFRSNFADFSKKKKLNKTLQIVNPSTVTGIDDNKFKSNDITPSRSPLYRLTIVLMNFFPRWLSDGRQKKVLAGKRKKGRSIKFMFVW